MHAVRDRSLPDHPAGFIRNPVIRGRKCLRITGNGQYAFIVYLPGSKFYQRGFLHGTGFIKKTIWLVDMFSNKFNK